MPYTRHLGGWLSILDLRGTQNLRTFNSHKDGGVLRGQSFALLKNVAFNYHAHCCQLKRSNYSYYDSIVKRDISSQHIFQRLYNYFFDWPRSSEHLSASDGQLNNRYTRQTIPDENSTDDLLTCLNYTDLNIVPFSDSNTIDIREMDNCTDLPEGWYFHPNTTDLICTDNEIVNITTQVYRPCTDESPSPIAPSHTVSAILDISPTPTTLQTDTVGPASSPLPTMVISEKTTPADSVTPAACSSSMVKVFCTLTTAATPSPTTMPLTTMPPTTSAPPSCTCTASPFVCQICEDRNCNHPACATVNSCSVDCHSKRRRRYIPAIEGELRLKRDTTDTHLPDGWFYPNPDNTSFACILISENTTNELPITTASESSTATTATLPPTSASANTDPNVGTICTSTGIPLDGRLPLHELSTVCSPLEDPFNPCEDLLGRDHVLRSFIWIVIILALVGNFLVILVFLGYTVITKRTKVELFVVHFFYFNLAVADFLMGIYLLTIAVQDLRTLGNFSMFDIAWRTEGGCDFAGFCAITSTMVSVYVLLVITVERLYTFSRALQKSHTSKTIAIILMAVGWGFGILMGILPVITKDVNDYTRTAICLPFDVSSKLALSYILFLLLFTGVVFTAIAICYIIIFYQVFYRQKATISSVSDKKRWKIELKVALRMGTLVLTNFICWFPIALLGISAAVGNSLVNNINFAKWVMVFIFPINACLNPILYSILSKVFRDNLVLILGKCGLCKDQISKIKRHRAGFTPSITSNHSRVSGETGLVSDSRRGTIMERFRNFSITSTTNLLGRRGSTMSQASSEERYQIELIRAQRRRSSEYSSASSEDILGVKVNSRRGSAFSGGSMEEMTTFSNPGFRSSSPVGGSAVVDGVAGNHKGSPRPRISLGAVPEENENFVSEILVAPELSGEDKKNPAYLDNEIEYADTSANKEKHNIHGNGIITSSQAVSQHRIINSETENDSTIGVAPGEHVSSITTDSVDTRNEKMITVADSSSLSTDSDHYVHEIVSIDFD